MNDSVIKFPSRMSQNKDFRNLKLVGGYTPSDIDVAYEIGGHTFIFGELKLTDTPFPTGQRLLLKYIAESHQKAGHNVLVFVAEHDAPVTKDIDVGNAIVWFMWMSNKNKLEGCVPKNKFTVKEICSGFLKHNNIRAE